MRLEDIYGLWNFIDVSCSDLLMLSLERVINFDIDLVLDIGPISLLPYRMILVELKELKTQL